MQQSRSVNFIHRRLSPSKQAHHGPSCSTSCTSASPFAHFPVLLVLMLAFMASSLPSTQAKVYLSVGSGRPTLWNGDCDSPPVACATSPGCDAPTSMTITGSNPCEIELSGSGRWDALVNAVSLKINVATDFDFEATYLQLTGPVTIEGISNPRPTLSGYLTFDVSNDRSATVTIKEVVISKASFSIMSPFATFLTFDIYSSTIIKPLDFAGDTFGFPSYGAGTPAKQATVSLTHCDFSFYADPANDDYHTFMRVSTDILASSLNMTRCTQIDGIVSPMTGDALIISPGRVSLSLYSTQLYSSFRQLIITTIYGGLVQLDRSSSISSISPPSILAPLVSDGISYKLIVLDDCWVIGFRIKFASIEMQNQAGIINCPLTVASSTTFLIRSGTVHLLMDNTISPTPPWYSKVIFQDGSTINFGNHSSSLVFSPVAKRGSSSYVFSGAVNIGSEGFSCTWSPFRVDLDDSTHVQTFCKTIMTEGIYASNTASTTSFHGSGLELASLSVDGSYAYQTNLILSEFHNLTITPNRTNPLTTAIQSSSSGTTIISIPGNVRIVWPTGIAPPVVGTSYPLFETVGSINDSVVLPMQDGDIYEWLLTYSPGASTTSASYRLNLFPAPENAPAPHKYCPPPPPGFNCTADGTWVAIGDVTLHAPFIMTTVLVRGNFSVDGSITFDGNGNSLIIDGCLTLKDGSIVVDLSSGNWKTGTVALISQKDDCPTALNQLPVTVKQPKHGCKKVKSKIDSSSTRSTLNVLFSADNSACNTKWIILGAVLGGVIIVGVVVTIVVISVVRAAQNRKSRARLA